MKAGLVGLILLLIPFLVGWGIFALLNPIGFYQMLFTFLACILICVPLGLFTWIIGLALIFEDWW